jgi:hypothetical protein
MLPEHPVPVLLLRVIETGVEVFVPAFSGAPFVATFRAATDEGWSDLEHALRVAVASAEARSSPRARFSHHSSGGPVGSAGAEPVVAEAAFIIGGFVLFDAVRWQRVGIVALLPWAVIAVTAAIVVARVMGENPEAPGSSVPAIVGILVGVGGWVLTTRWAYRRFPPTARQRAAASSADREFLRTQTPAVGCIVGGAWLFLGGVVLAVLGPEASRGPVGGVVLVIMLIGVVVMPILAVRYVRRRYPPDPQTPEQGLANRVMLLLVLAIVLILVVILILAGVSGRFDPT